MTEQTAFLAIAATTHREYNTWPILPNHKDKNTIR